MIYDFSNNLEIAKFDTYVNRLKKNKQKAKLEKVTDNRTAKQNKALHLFFTMIADELNDLGIQFQYKGLKGLNLEMRYTPHLVKEMIWRPIQMSLFDIESTTKIDTFQINEIIDILTLFFSERGVVLEFPNIETLIE